MATTKTKTPTSKVLYTIPIAENRELRISEIKMEPGNLIRIGVYTGRGKTLKPLSGATFPANVLGNLVSALQAVQEDA